MNAEQEIARLTAERDALRDHLRRAEGWQAVARDLTAQRDRAVAMLRECAVPLKLLERHTDSDRARRLGELQREIAALLREVDA